MFRHCSRRRLRYKSRRLRHPSRSRRRRRLRCRSSSRRPRQSCLFAGVEIGLLFPHVNNGLIAPVTIQPFGVGDTVTLPAAGLDSAAAPQITLGYRLRDDLGAIILTYRNLSSEGRVYVPNFDFAGDGIVESRLDINTVGLAYSTEEHPLGALDHALGNGREVVVDLF